jgi:hypothetical protein
MRLTPQEAGAKGGRSRSVKKIAACRRNGFQPSEPLPPEEQRLRDLDVEQWKTDAKLLGLPQDIIDSVAEMKADGRVKDTVGLDGKTVFPHPINLTVLVAKRRLAERDEKASE